MRIRSRQLYRSRRPFLVALATFSTVALSYTLPGLLPGRVFVPLDLPADQGAWKPDQRSRVAVSNRLLSDPVLEFVPWDAATRAAISSGDWPWVNPFAAEGRPLFANPQTALLSPFTWPRLLFGLHGWGIAVFSKLVVAGLGAWWLTRELGASPNAALLSGLVYLLSGFSIVWGLHPHTNTFATLPILAAALHRLLRQRTRSNTLFVIGAAAFAAAGGHPETLAVGLVGIAAFLLWNGLSSSEATGAPSRRNVSWTILSAAVGFVLLSVQFVPFLELLSESAVVHTRSSAPPSHFRVVAVVGQVLPGFLGSPLGGEIDFSGTSTRAENFNARNQSFVGALTLMALAIAGRRQSSSFRRAFMLGTSALPFAWGVPPLGLVLSRTPLLSLIAAPYWVAVFVLWASVAAGPAVETLSHGAPRRLAGSVLVAAGLLLVGAGVLPSAPASRDLLLSGGRRGVEILRRGGFLKHPREVYEARMGDYLVRGRWMAVRRLALPGAFWVLGGAALRSRRRRGRLLGVAMVGELVAFGVGYLPGVPLSRVPQAPEVVRVVQRLDPCRRWKIAAAADIYPPDLATLHQIRDVRSHDVLQTEEWSRRMHEYGYDEFDRAFPPSLRPEQAESLAAEGVRFFFSREPSAGTRLVGGAPPPGVGVYEIAGAVPSTLPANRRPPGLPLGAALSLLALVSSGVLVRRARARLSLPVGS